jgi:sugar lactone lactonase YvrE
MCTRYSISRMFLLSSTGIIGICLMTFIGACKKNSLQAPVIISGISPVSGAHNTIVTITGSGFNANTDGDSVKFNGVGAVVQQASSTQLTVLVPKAAGTGPVTVKTGSLSGTGPTFNFTYTYTVSTLAGTGTAGFANGDGNAAQFYTPGGVASDEQGNIYVADYGNSRIRKISPGGVVSTLAGSGTAGFANGDGNAAQFNHPYGIALDTKGNIYVADINNNRIRKITPAGSVSTLAGSGTLGFADGNGAAAQFNQPLGVATDAQGNVYVADNYNHRIRKISPAGVVSTLAGGSIAGFADGNGSIAQFYYPTGVASDAQGSIYVADGGNNSIRKISPGGVVSTLAGSGTQGFANGNGNAAQFYFPIGMASDAQGNIYVADTYNNRIRKITPAGAVSTLAGTGTAGFADGNGDAAQFNSPYGIALDTKGNIYVADSGNYMIRLITVE